MANNKKYDELKKKYKLPSYNEFDKDFEISDIEDNDSFLLRKIRKKIAERIEAYEKVLESFLVPSETSLTCLYECQVFTDEQKRKMYLLFKKLMYFDRMSTEVSINEDDKKTSVFINELWKQWPEMKKNFSEAVIKLKEGWTKEIKLKEEQSYLG